MKSTITALTLWLTAALALVPGLAYGQKQSQLPDWSGAWSMVGGTVFDRATQTGQGGAITPGVREHPPYNAEWEAKYAKNLALRDKGLFPDVFTNCGVPGAVLDSGGERSQRHARLHRWTGASRGAVGNLHRRLRRSLGGGHTCLYDDR